MSELHPYIAALKRGLEQRANADNAVQMKQYMRGRYAFYGVRAPERREILREVNRRHGLPGAGELHDHIKSLWEIPRREAQQMGVDLAVHMRRKLNTGDLSLFEWMIVNKPWWDTVDAVAVNLVDFVLKPHPVLWKSRSGRWITSGDPWLQRTALLFQLKYKEATDADLLFWNIKRLMHEQDFFIRKAIGWALRQYARTRPEEVKAFVREHTLSKLSSREALRHLN